MWDSYYNIILISIKVICRLTLTELLVCAHNMALPRILFIISFKLSQQLKKMMKHVRIRSIITNRRLI